MNIDLKTLVKQHVAISNDNTSAVVMLEKVHDGDWELARKSEYKRDVYYIPDSDLFFEVCFIRSGAYHNEYTYAKPKFRFVHKTVKDVVEYPAITDQKSLAIQLQSEYFDQHDETSLTPVYSSGWLYSDKAHIFENVFEIDGKLLKQTLYGNSDWTEWVEYDMVTKVDRLVVSYKNK